MSEPSTSDGKGRLPALPCGALMQADRLVKCSRAALNHCSSFPSPAVVILFKQTGDAPILKQNKVKVRLESVQRSLCAPVAGRCRLPPAATPLKAPSEAPADDGQPLLLPTQCRSAGRTSLQSLWASFEKSWAETKWCACDAVAAAAAGRSHLAAVGLNVWLLRWARTAVPC